MTPAPSIDAVSGLVADLRGLSAYPGDAYDRAADALEAKARELAAKEVVRVALCRDLNSATKRQVELEDRIAALEDAVRVKDEALVEAIEFADQDAQVITPAGIAMVERWRAAVSPAENPCPHAPTYDAGLCCGNPDDCTFVSPLNLAKEENDA